MAYRVDPETMRKGKIPFGIGRCLSVSILAQSSDDLSMRIAKKNILWKIVKRVHCNREPKRRVRGWK